MRHSQETTVWHTVEFLLTCGAFLPSIFPQPQRPLRWITYGAWLCDLRWSASRIPQNCFILFKLKMKIRGTMSHSLSFPLGTSIKYWPSSRAVNVKGVSWETVLYGTRFQPAEMPGLERKQRGSVLFMPMSRQEGQQHKLLDKDLLQ